jgi:hypothetical protein
MKKRFWVKSAIYIIPTDATTATTILKQCSQEKIPFYSSNKFPHEKHELSTEQAVAQFLEGMHPVNPYYSIGFAYDNEPFLLEFYPYKSEPATWVQLSALGNVHCKKGETGIMRVDLAYYATLLLLLCKNLPIVEFLTIVDGETPTQSA